MPDLAAALNKHHAKLAQMHGDVVGYGGGNYTVPVSINAETIQLEEGGIRPGKRLEARLPKSSVATAPKPRETVTHAGEIYLIESVLGHETWAREWVIVALR